jgi:Flp pilus assembly protein TadD
MRSSPADSDPLAAQEGPFFPSQASLRQGVSTPPQVFSNVETCGRAGCHPQTVAEWESSSHRFSGLDNPWYRATFEEARSAIGTIPSRWCAGCHTPALLLSGLADRPAAELAETPAGRAGVSCTVCHSISHVEGVTGQAAFELSPPPADSPLFREGGLQKRLFSLLVRRNPESHRSQFAPAALQGERSSEACSTCHRGSVDSPVNGHGWLGIFDDYSPWQSSDFSGQSVPRRGDPTGTRGCVDCHMPRVLSRDPGSREGWARSHRFAAANTALPALRGDREQLQAVSDFLRAGHVTVDLFALVQGEGATLDFRAPLNRVPASLRQGSAARVDVLVQNRGVGHLFPGGKQDLHECWLELRAVDETGRTLFWSGRADEAAPVDLEAHPFRVTWVDEKGDPVENHRLWAARVQVNSQLIEAGGAQIVMYELPVPVGAGERITLIARLHYRPLSWDFTRWAFSKLRAPAPRLPIVTLAEDSITLPVIGADAPAPEPAQPTPVAADFERWNGYGLGLVAQGNLRAAREAFLRAFERKPDFAAGLANHGRMVMMTGDIPGARARLDEALRLDPGFLRTRLVVGQLEKQEGQYERAIEHLRAVTLRYPRDLEARRELGSVLFLLRDYEGALAEFLAALKINPEDGSTHFLTMQAYSALRDHERAKAESSLFTRYRRDPRVNILMRDYFQKYPQGNLEMGRHQHRSLPPEQLVPRGPGRDE